MAGRSDLSIRIDAEFPGEGSFKSAEASAKLLARELDKLEAAQRSMAAAEAAAYREGEKAAADHEAAVRKMAATEIAAYREQEKAAEEATRKRHEAMTEVGKVSMAAGAVAAAGLGLAVKAYADFDAAMSSVQAATHESAANMNLLREAAIDAGAATSFSATEAAQAQEELSKAGVSTADILGGALKGSLDLASAGNLGVAESAEIAATALSQYGLGGDQAGHVADLLAAGAGKAQGSVQDLSGALKYVGPVAAGMNVSIEESVGALAALASQGIIGEQAGTSLRGMLSSLTSPSKAAAAEIEELGIHLYDAQGNFLGLTNAAGELSRVYGPMTDAQRDASLGVLFGNEQVTAARVIYKQGAEGVQAWTDAVNDSGYASETAAIKMDNLKGDAEKLGGALSTALVNTGESSSGVLRSLTQDVTTLVDMFNEAPEPVQESVTALGGVVAAAGLAGGAAVSAVPQVAEFYEALGSLGAAGAGVQKGLAKAAGFMIGPWGLAIGAAVGVAAIFVKSQIDARQRVDTLADALDAQTGAITENARAIVAKSLADSGALEDAKRFGFSLDTVTDAALGNKAAMAQLREQADAMPGTFNGMRNTMVDLADGSRVSAKEIDSFVSSVAGSGAETDKAAAKARLKAEAMGEDADATAAAGDASQSAAGQVAGLSGATDESAEAMQKLGDSIRSALGMFFDVEDATSAVEAAIDDMTEAVKKNGSSVDLSTEKGRANADALQDRVTTAGDLIAAMAREGKSTEELSAKTQQLKDDFVKQATQAGFSQDAIAHYAQAFDLIPAQYATTLTTPGLDEARTKLGDILTKVDKLNGKTITTRFQTTGDLPRSGFGGAGTVARAEGGPVYGAGTSTSDSIPARLSNGEFVVKASSVAAYGLPMLHAVNEGRFAQGGLVTTSTMRALANGGPAAAGTVVTRAMIAAALGMTTGPVTSDRRDAALTAEALAARQAELAEARLDAVRQASAEHLKAYQDQLDATEQALKDQHTAAEDAAQDEITRLRSSKASDAAITAATDRLTALKRANDAAEKALARANDDQADAAKAANKAAEADATDRLTAAKEKEKAATDELSDAESELADARQRAMQLAQQVADNLTRSATITSAWGDDTARAMTTAATALAKAAKTADGATDALAGESAAEALTRRTEAVKALAQAGLDYAASQADYGFNDAQVQAGLDAVREKVLALAEAYGFTQDQVTDLTDSMKTQSRTGADLLSSMQRQLVLTQEFAANVRRLMSAGLDSGLLDQIIAAGTGGGGLEMSRAILSGDTDLVSSLNDAQAQLTAAANDLGATVSGARYGVGGTATLSATASGSGSLTATLDASSVTLLQQAMTAIANRPVITQLADGRVLASTVNAVNDSLAYRTS